MSTRSRLPSYSFQLTPTRAPAPAAEVPSPCINICRMNQASGLCEGCWRNIDEIALWSQLDTDDKRSVMSLVEMRRNDLSSQPDPFGP
jgi:predicted Fe-S protein YdhL (DUF1289 family)